METMPEVFLKVFKQCPMCGEIWTDRTAFLSDPLLDYVGYQTNFKRPEAGLFLFNHTCKTTVAIKVQEVQDLYSGPIFNEALTAAADCPGYCLYEDEVRPCPLECECAWVREIIPILRDWPKHS